MREKRQELDNYTEAICVRMAKKYTIGYGYLGYEFEDVLQDARMLALEAMSDYARQVSPSCSVYTAVYTHVNRRLFRYWLRKKKRGEMYMLTGDLEIEQDHIEPGCDADTAFNHALVNQICEQNAFIKLFYQHHCNQEHTAQALGIASSSVRSRLQTVRRHYTEEKEEKKLKLTRSEKQVFELFNCGFTRKTAAEFLFLSPRTIDFHIQNVYRKLDCKNMNMALARCRQESLI